jgi:hypothetical protein
LWWYVLTVVVFYSSILNNASCVLLSYDTDWMGVVSFYYHFLQDMTDSGPRAQDIFLDQRAQCNGEAGVCPDTEMDFTNDVTGVSGDQDFGLTVIRYTRPLVPTDAGEVSSLNGDVDQSIDATVSYLWKHEIRKMGSSDALSLTHQPFVNFLKHSPESRPTLFGLRDLSVTLGILSFIVSPMPEKVVVPVSSLILVAVCRIIASH